MTIAWRFTCDGTGCKSAETLPPLDKAPPGWMVRTTIDEVVSLEERSDLSSGRASSLQSIKHFCPSCRRRAA